MTLLEALTWGEAQIRATLSEKRFPTMHHPKLDAQILLAHALEKPPKFLATHLADPLPSNLFDAYHRLIERRARHEPIAHLTGSRGFYDREMIVTHDTLIPRPETELMIEEALQHASKASVIVDVGTGSGAIAVTIAALTNLPTFATDTSARALRIAEQNAAANHVEHLVTFKETSLIGSAIEHLRGVPRLLLLANLPYVPLRTKVDMDPDVLRYEPHEAIFAGVDGLDAYDALLQEIQTHRSTLPAHITALFEIDPSHLHSLPRLVQSFFPHASVEIKNDLSRRPRLAVIHLPPKSQST